MGGFAGSAVICRQLICLSIRRLSNVFFACLIWPEREKFFFPCLRKICRKKKKTAKRQTDSAIDTERAKNMWNLYCNYLSLLSSKLNHCFWCCQQMFFPTHTYFSEFLLTLFERVFLSSPCLIIDRPIFGLFGKPRTPKRNFGFQLILKIPKISPLVEQDVFYPVVLFIWMQVIMKNK